MGSKTAKRKRTGLDSGASWVSLKRRCSQRGRQIRLGTLAWSGLRADLTYLTDDEFLRSLTAAKPGADLVLCAGRRVWPCPHPKDVLRASGQSPVLFEVCDEDTTYGEVGKWWLIQPSRSDVLRGRQILSSYKADPSERTALARTLAMKGGTVMPDGTGVHLQLLICGENNILSSTGGSVLKGGAPWAAKAKALQSQWILLNPAHRPYRAPSRSAGAAKVCHVGD